MPNVRFHHIQSGVALSVVLASALMGAACTRADETRSPEGEQTPKTQGDEAPEADLRPMARALAQAYSALSAGDLEGAAAAFAPEVLWRTRTVDTVELRGREALTAHLRARRTADSRDVGLARVFVGGDEFVIGQGRFVDHEGSKLRVTGFVSFARVEGDQLVDVTEQLAPAQVDTTDPKLPAELEILFDDPDPVRQTMAETLDDAWSSNDWGRIDNMFATDFAYHNLGAGVEARGLKAYRALFERRAEPFPDMSFEIVNSWSSGEWVVLDKRIRGTHTAPFGELAPTNRAIEFSAVDVLRFSGEEIVEIWSYYDPRAIAVQLGVG